MSLAAIHLNPFKNWLEGQGNINPRKTYSQQQGAKFLKEELQLVSQQHCIDG